MKDSPYVTIGIRQEVYAKARDYFRLDSKELYAPSKSFSVAVIYANLLAENFGGSAQSYLEDPELLDNDPYWVAYRHDEQIYDALMEDYKFRDDSLPNMQSTKKYFLKEFLLG